jgi:hypothetical protein
MPSTRLILVQYLSIRLYRTSVVLGFSPVSIISRMGEALWENATMGGGKLRNGAMVYMKAIAFSLL